MKTWTMPRMIVETYAANEYVASCSDAGEGYINLTCSASSARLNPPINSQLTHADVDSCTVTIKLTADSVYKLGSNQKFVSDQGYYEDTIPRDYVGNMYWANKAQANDGSGRYVIVWQSVRWTGSEYQTPGVFPAEQHWIFTDGRWDSNPTS